MEDTQLRNSALSRRAFVRFAAGGLVVGGVALLEACGPSGPQASQPTPAAAAPVQATAAPKPTVATTSVSAPASATAAPKPASQAQPFSVPGQIGVSKTVEKR